MEESWLNLIELWIVKVHLEYFCDVILHVKCLDLFKEKVLKS